jgi:hypothetical protein
MRRAVVDYRADWVLPLDVDEFVQAHGGADAFRRTLNKSQQPRKLWMHDYAPHPHDAADEPNVALRITHWTGAEKRPQLKIMVPRSFAADLNVSLSGGNHELYGPQGVIVAEEAADLWLAHFPARSCAQVVAKVIVGELQRLANSSQAYHYETHYHHLAAGGGDYFHEPSTYLRGLYSRPAQYWGQPIRYTPPLSDWPRLAASLLPFMAQLASNYGQARTALERRSWWQRFWHPTPLVRRESMRECRPGAAITMSDYGAKLEILQQHCRADSVWFRLRATNLRAATWHCGVNEPGIVNIGVQAWNAAGRLSVLDHHRQPLPHNVAPGESVVVDVECLPPPGGYCTVNMVVEHIGWFDTPTAMVDPQASQRHAA